MSVVSFIEEPKTTDRIIRHLELRFEAERPPPPRVVQQHQFSMLTGPSQQVNSNTNQ